MSMDTNPSNAQPTAWRRGRSPRVAAQRGRQRRHLRRANHSRAARPTTQPAPWRESRQAESGREILSRAGPGWLFTAHRQSRCRQADGTAITRRHAPATILRARLFRHILCLRRGSGRALLSRPANETLGRGKGRARRRRVGRHEDGLNCDFLRREDWR